MLTLTCSAMLRTQVRLLKLFRFLKLGRVIKRWEESLDMNPAYFRFARLLIAILFLSHLVACMWFGIYRFVVPVGTPFNTIPNWFEDYAMQQLTPEATQLILTDPLTQYLSAMYWAFTTMTTVGYGDIIPHNLCARRRARPPTAVSPSL